MSKRDKATPRWTCWVPDERSHRLRNRETTLMTGARHILYEYATESEPPGRLPKDPETLADWAGLTKEEWAEVGPRLIRGWKEDGDSYVVARIETEMFEANGTKKSRQKAGKKGAAKRWNDKELNSQAIAEPLASVSQTHSNPNGNPNGKPMANDTLPNPNPNPNPQREEKQRGGPGTRGGEPDLRAEGFLEPTTEEKSEPERRTLGWDPETHDAVQKLSVKLSRQFGHPLTRLQTWYSKKRIHERAHGRAVLEAMRDAHKRGPGSPPDAIGALEPWLNAAIAAKSQAHNAADSEAIAARQREDNAANAAGFFSGGAR